MAQTDVYREYISNLQSQVDNLNLRVDSIQHAVDICRDSIGTLNTTIAENGNWISMVKSPYGLAFALCVLAVVAAVLLKRGVSVKRGDTSINVGGTDEKA